ncbi:MAG: N-acyl homoserine lactonase family protein [Pseudomonadota bacterium]
MPRNYIIHPIPLMKVEFPKPKMTYLMNFGETIPIVIYVWFLEGGERTIIVDAGITPERLIKRGYKVEPIQSLADGLSRVGLTVGDVDLIIATHLHHDHFYLAHEFPRAEVIVQEAEIQFARNPHPMIAQMWPADYRELLVGLQFRVVEGDTRVDDGVELLLTPGHSAGTQSVAINTNQGTAIIAGFCCIRENFDPPPAIKDRMPLIAPGINLNALQAYESVERVKKLADMIVPIHEADLIDKATIP